MCKAAAYLPYSPPHPLQPDGSPPPAPPPCLLPAGHSKTIEFAFDVSDDTAENIAAEMMEDLSLSHEEARVIAEKIRIEVARVALEKQHEQQRLEHEQQEQALRAGRLQQQEQQEQAVLQQQWQAAQEPRAPDVPQPSLSRSRSTNTAGAGGSSSNRQSGEAPPLPLLSSKSICNGRCSSSSTGGANGYATGQSEGTPDGGSSLKAPSIHALIAAMREVHEEEALERQGRAMSPPPASSTTPNKAQPQNLFKTL